MKTDEFQITTSIKRPHFIDKTVSSLCPICLKIIDAHIFQKGEAVMIEKRCKEHGNFMDTYWSNIILYERFMRYWIDGLGIEISSPKQLQGCPLDCGLCENHKTGTLIANIDITNRCNLSCPVCFADAGDITDEPTINQIHAMMQSLRNQRPVPCSAIQFSGGEPTIRDDLPEIVALAQQMGFYQIQVATNGIRLAKDLKLCNDLARNGLTTIYLQFDGVTPEPYKILRGCDLLPSKYNAIKNLRIEKQIRVVLVPTLVKSVNDSQVGDIVKFAFKNSDMVKGVNFQPISFTGRIDQEEMAKKRITIPDIILLLEDQTDNEITRDDFYPVPFVAPVSNFIAMEFGVLQPSYTVHPCCGAGTYVYSIEGRMIPITRFVDVEAFMEFVKELVENYDGTRLGRLNIKARLLLEMHKFIDGSKVPGNPNLSKLVLKVFRDMTWESLAEFANNSLFLGIMHFQDLYNIDLERLERCGIHYVLPDGSVIPFCAHNIIHRSLNNKRI
jgi:uncharacterized radical SAM superfamily Fe-S cluster-containing enzyme